VVVCIVTIHGIGFQVPPKDDRGIAGYADGLHQRLSEALGPDTPLGNDPERLEVGVRGPVYVHSNWPPGTPNIELGIRRLGSWTDDRPGRVTTDKRLVPADEPFAHVALVYSNLEEKAQAIGPLLTIAAMSATALPRYRSPFDLVRMAVTDGVAMLSHRATHNRQTPSLQVRKVEPTPPVQQMLGREPGPVTIEPEPTGLAATLVQLQNDVAAYVTRNVLRQRVRSFVNECLLRLAYRPDVEGIIVNAHSQGTVVAFDVLRDFPVVAHHQIKGLITAGSPLRKYVTLFNWGGDVGCVANIPWTNFWDAHDPVADALLVPALFRVVHPETGAVDPVVIAEHQVDNLKHSTGGGLQAHNYWDNSSEFVEPLAHMLKDRARP
jgi:hypothetical protein